MLHNCCSTAEPVIDLNELVKNSRSYPFTASEFRKFLSKSHCEENFDFVVKVDGYRGVEEEKRTPTAVQILNQFIVEGATQQINIDSTTRNTVIHETSVAAKATTFDPPDSEVRKLLQGGRYISQFVTSATQNITAKEANNRYVVGILGLLAALALGLCLWLAIPQASRWYRLTTFPLAFLGISYTLSAKTRT